MREGIIEAAAVMEAVLALATLPKLDKLPDDLQPQAVGLARMAQERLTELARQHLGFVVGDTVTVPLYPRLKAVIVDGFYLDDYGHLRIRLRSLKKDGSPSQRTDTFSAIADIHKLD